MPRVFYSWGSPSPSPHASTAQSDAGCWPGLAVIPPARPRFVLPTSLWGPARSSSLQPGPLQVASLMRTTWDLRGGGGETWVERETDAGPGGPTGKEQWACSHRTWEPGGQGRARRRGSEVSCAGVVAGGDLDEAEPVRPQPWREEEGPSSLPLCRLTQWPQLSLAPLGLASLAEGVRFKGSLNVPLASSPSPTPICGCLLLF